MSAVGPVEILSPFWDRMATFKKFLENFESGNLGIGRSRVDQNGLKSEFWIQFSMVNRADLGYQIKTRGMHLGCKLWGK